MIRREQGSDAPDGGVEDCEATEATDAGTTTAPGAESGTHGDPAAVTDTFTLLSDETRVRIVLALYDASEEAVRFSDLRSRVGVRDGGRFNYHLDRLRGHLVEKTGAGYALTDAGERVASLV